MNKQITSVLCAVCLFAGSLFSCGDTENGITAGNGVYVIPGETVIVGRVTETAITEAAEIPGETDAEIITETELPTEPVLRVLSAASPVKQGRNAKLTALGIPGTEYAIAVYYSSGKSEAAGLTEKTANEKGLVSWTWKVGGRTKPGTYRITVTGGGETVETEFTVTE